MPSESEVRSWLVDHLADLLDISAADIEPDGLLSNYGLDSVGAVSTSGAMEEQFQVELDPAIFLRALTVDAIVAALKARGVVQ
jgi:acyl carrier protein